MRIQRGRLRAWGTLTLLAALVGASGRLVSGNSVPKQPTLTIVIKTVRPFSPASLRQMKSEFDAIMSPIADVQWRTMEGVSGAETFDEVVVTSFTGSCEVDESWHPGWVRRKLAGAYGSREQLQPFAEIDCDAVRMMLMNEMPSRNLSELQSMLGRGLGRILAHEIYHILLNTREHSRSGLAKSGFAPSDLFTGTLQFESAQIHELSARLSRTVLAAATY